MLKHAWLMQEREKIDQKV
jgi:Ca2+-binding EF-hand superfamily protein